MSDRSAFEAQLAEAKASGRKALEGLLATIIASGFTFVSEAEREQALDSVKEALKGAPDA